MTAEPYNPLDKQNLAQSIESALLLEEGLPLEGAKRFLGAGVYAIYYSGSIEWYLPIRADLGADGAVPIYVGKAIPEGGRIGGLGNDAAAGRSLANRLGAHRRSLAQASNLHVTDFWVRYLLVDDIWIPLGENVLIETFQPVWNVAIYGFGNNAPGKGRQDQVKSPWDILHPGRKAFARLPDGELNQEFVTRRVSDHLAGLPLEPLPSSVSQSVEDDSLTTEEAATRAGNMVPET